MTDPLVGIHLHAGAHLGHLLDAALTSFEFGPRAIVAATSDGPLNRALEAALRRKQESDVTSVFPDGPGLFGHRDTVEAQVRAPGARLKRVGLPSLLVSGQPLVLAVDLTSRRIGDPLVIDAWSKFARRRERIAASVFDRFDRQRGEHRDSVSPEIASVVDLSLVVLLGKLSHGQLLISTSDQIAAELAGRALGILQSDPDTEQIGPWEDPLLQRATELGLGVSHPNQLVVRSKWLGDLTDSGATELAFVARAMAERLGIRTVRNE